MYVGSWPQDLVLSNLTLRRRNILASFHVILIIFPTMQCFFLIYLLYSYMLNLICHKCYILVRKRGVFFSLIVKRFHLQLYVLYILYMYYIQWIWLTGCKLKKSLLRNLQYLKEKRNTLTYKWMLFILLIVII